MISFVVIRENEITLIVCISLKMIILHLFYPNFDLIFVANNEP